MTSLRPFKPALLQVSGLRKSVPGGRLLFSNLDFDLAAGDFVAVTGESGVGKSTLLNLIAGLDLADAGTVRIEDVEVAALDDDARTLLRRDRVGFVFQAFHVLPHLTLVQNVALPLALQRLPAGEALDRAAAALGDVGLAGREKDLPSRLSGGELQRVAIARALVHRPALILADEPTGNLDPETAGRILDIFNAQARGQGAAVLLVTHSEMAAATADRVLQLTANGLAPRHGR